jgi:arylsulfatase
MFTGREVTEHRVFRSGDQLKPGYSIWNWLESRGYNTGVFSQNPFLTSDTYGLVDGFDTVKKRLTESYDQRGINPEDYDVKPEISYYIQFLRDCLSSDHPFHSMLNGLKYKINIPEFDAKEGKTAAEEWANIFLDWQADQDGPWAACINLMDAHSLELLHPDYYIWGGSELVSILEFELSGNGAAKLYTDREPWWKQQAIEALYDNAIRQADAGVSTVIEHLQRRNDYDNTLVIITSDHGQGFAELSRVRPGVRIVNHVLGIHEVLTHVPLVIRPPGGSELSEVSVPVSLSRIHDCIRNFVSLSQTNSKPLVSDKSVIVSSYSSAPSNPNNTHWEPYIGELDQIPWDGTARAVYKMEDDCISKYALWGENEATIKISNARNSMKTSNRGGEIVKNNFKEYPSDSLRFSDTSEEDIDKQTLEQMKDMGYI